MKEYMIDLCTTKDIDEFIELITNNIASNVDAIRDYIVIDARSYLGVCALSFRPFLVRINSDDQLELEEFRKICERFSA